MSLIRPASVVRSPSIFGQAVTCAVAFCLGALATTPAAAQVYRSVGPDGKVIYSDKPPAGARDSRIVDIPAPPTSAPSAEGQARRQEDQRQYEQLLQRGREQSAALDRARGEMTAAQDELDAAKKRLAEGAEPIPGERMGTAGGTSRLGEAYFERQQQLERAVRDAEAKLDRAQRAYNQLR